MQKKFFNKKNISLFLVAVFAIVLIFSAISPISIRAITDETTIITDFDYSQSSFSTDTTSKEIPTAATPNYNYLVTGIIIIILGVAFFMASRKR
ncbi:hypothetical protein CIB95_15895 [Lottiidibacillus patelloidae]|uniref:Uncharacterized protein n=2 Tax=Lottiidibacillus patelloidae TaxID=2670334 RepID=A0A263BPM1_9BACI|nr:hypothetical protein CIB95_15895 [Lottiidibacillus patelloidae]